MGRHIGKIYKDKLTEMRLLGMPMHRWEDNIEMRLKELGVLSKTLIFILNPRPNVWSLKALLKAIQVRFQVFLYIT